MSYIRMERVYQNDRNIYDTRYAQKSGSILIDLIWSPNETFSYKNPSDSEDRDGVTSMPTSWNSRRSSGSLGTWGRLTTPAKMLTSLFSIQASVLISWPGLVHYICYIFGSSLAMLHSWNILNQDIDTDDIVYLCKPWYTYIDLQTPNFCPDTGWEFLPPSSAEKEESANHINQLL